MTSTNYLTIFILENTKDIEQRRYFPDMAKYMRLLSLALMLVLGIGAAQAQDFPEAPNRLVNDYTGTLRPAEVDALARRLLLFDDSTSIQIAVVVMQSTGAYDIADYAVRLAQKWGVGQSKYNKGIMAMASLGDRAGTIQTDYDNEETVTDAINYQINETETKL